MKRQAKLAVRADMLIQEFFFEEAVRIQPGRMTCSFPSRNVLPTQAGKSLVGVSASVAKLHHEVYNVLLIQARAANFSNGGKTKRGKRMCSRLGAGDDWRGKQSGGQVRSSQGGNSRQVWSK